MNFTDISINRNEIFTFARRQTLLLFSLFFLALGVALCVRSDLGSSVISSAPYAFFLAGGRGMVPDWSLGMYTNILNVLLVMGQIIVLRRRYRPWQLLQLLIGVVFGVLIDASMAMTAFLESVEGLGIRMLVMLAGSTLMALGVSMEMRCASITMPGEGLPAALSKVTGKSFADMKILTDTLLVAAAIASSFLFFGEWKWNIVGGGTLFAMLYIGMAVKFFSRHLGWFDRLLQSKHYFS